MATTKQVVKEPAKDLTPRNDQLPAYAQGMKSAALPGVDASDLILPRIKLLQGISPEVETYDAAKAGLFWHSVLGESIGSQFDFIVTSFSKKYLLLAPLGDSRKVLARAENGVDWVPPSGEFRVKLKKVRDEQTWKLAPTVRESGLAEFGSSVKGDPDSVPAAVLIYQYLLFLPERPDISPIVMSLARSQAKKGRDLNSKITFRNAPLQAQRFTASVIEETGEEGPYKNYLFLSHGFATETEYRTCIEIAERFGDYKAHDEENVATEGDIAARGDAKDTKEY